MSFLQVVIGIVGALVAGIVGWVIWYWYRVSKEVVSQVEVLNPGGERGTALLVYHTGRRGFLHSVIQAFAGGLVSAGWRVEITTASQQAPTDLSGYDLLVLGGPPTSGHRLDPSGPTCAGLGTWKANLL